jgi:hypothetical protein
MHACAQHGVYISMAGAIESGLICDQANALAFEFAKAVGFQNIEPGLRIRIARDDAMRARARKSFRYSR